MRIALVMAAVVLFVSSLGVGAQPPVTDGPRYTDEMQLIRPDTYREWVFLGAGLGMTYDPAPGIQSEAPQAFTNVFVNPSSYRAFMQSGMWPDRTIFVLEARRSSGEASINRAGRFQAELLGLEAEVKDARFPSGWAYFNLGPEATAAPLDAEAAAPCVQCHTEHGAVERTFVQFYPTLLEVAREKGTLNPGF